MATENKNLSNYDKNTIPNAKDFRFGIVVSEWNDKITEGLYRGAIEALTDCGALHKNIGDVFVHPGLACTRSFHRLKPGKMHGLKG